MKKTSEMKPVVIVRKCVVQDGYIDRMGIMYAMDGTKIGKWNPSYVLYGRTEIPAAQAEAADAA
jgi:hypothetical protein